jgi:FMN phosphatase YigB (HAD superfamily)
MVQKVQVSVICDLPHSRETEGQETVTFSFDGTAYEIDACAEHAKELRDKVAPFTEHARRASAQGRARKRQSQATASRQQSAQIREWAKSRGLKVSERGRIPASIVAQYEAAG